MTTKAKKFRIRRSTPSPAKPASTPRPPEPEKAEPFLDVPSADSDGLGDAPYPTAAPTSPQADDEISAIRKEGLTGRQLRMARRVAQKHGLAPTSDFDAVRLLRKQGIDPFERSNMLELVVPGGVGAPGEAEPSLPKTVKPMQLPSTEVIAADDRAREIMAMQRDIVSRRRKRLAQLVARLAFFVALPTIIASYYYYSIATPMYESHTEFVIQQAQPQGAAGMGGLFSGTSFATSQDSIAVQGYLQSRDAMLRLDDDLGFVTHFKQPDIDPLQRLEAGASVEAAYGVYKKRIKVSYDPTEGIIKLDAVAADPALSVAFSERLVEYAEEQVDNLTQRMREDQMRGAREGFEEADAKLIEAQEQVAVLQEKIGVLDPLAESSALMGQITSFETQAQQKRLELQQLLDNPRPNQARVAGVEGDIRRLDALVARLRSQLTEDSSEQESMARITGQLRLAETNLETRRLMMTQALQQMEAARTEANRQTRYLSMSVAPVAPDEATYPRAFENTMLAMLIFGGLYLMISITASILREQVAG